MAAQFSTLTLASDGNLVSYYKLENLNDETAGARTLTNTNSVAFNAGKFSNAADFGSANTNKALQRADNYGIGSGNFTFSFWVNITTAPTSGNEMTIVHIGRASDSRFFNVTYGNYAGTLKLRFLYGWLTGGETPADYTTTLTTGTWYHVAYTYDGTNIRGYINGALVIGPTEVTASSGSGGADVGAVGAFINISARYLSGLVDDYALFSRVLTVDEIANIYQGVDFINISVNDTITVTENVNVEEVNNISVNDAVTVTENVNVEEVNNISVNDAITVSEDVATDLQLDINLNDSITVTENINVELVSDISVNDAITVSEDLTISEDLGDVSVNDAITVTENINIELVSDISVNDTVTISESVTIDYPLDAIASDSITVSESVTMDLNLGDISVNDAITVAESVTIDLSQLGDVSVSDSITVSESTTLDLNYDLSVSDAVTVSEDVTMNEDLGDVSVNDAITVTESKTVEVAATRSGFIVMHGRDNEYPLAMDDSRIL